MYKQQGALTAHLLASEVPGCVVIAHRSHVHDMACSICLDNRTCQHVRRMHPVKTTARNGDATACGQQKDCRSIMTHKGKRDDGHTRASCRALSPGVSCRAHSPPHTGQLPLALTRALIPQDLLVLVWFYFHSFPQDVSSGFDHPFTSNRNVVPSLSELNFII
jgi:hypothetical protein